MKRTGDTREVAAVGQLEIGQKGNLLPENFPPDEKSGKWGEALDGRHEAVFLCSYLLHPFPGYLKFLFWRARNKGRSNEELRMNLMNLNIAFPFYSRKRNLSICDTV